MSTPLTFHTPDEMARAITLADDYVNDHMISYTIAAPLVMVISGIPSTFLSLNEQEIERAIASHITSWVYTPWQHRSPVLRPSRGSANTTKYI
jgi:hypothetical protein